MNSIIKSSNNQILPSIPKDNQIQIISEENMNNISIEDSIRDEMINQIPSINIKKTSFPLKLKLTALTQSISFKSNRSSNKFRSNDILNTSIVYEDSHEKYMINNSRKFLFIKENEYTKINCFQCGIVLFVYKFLINNGNSALYKDIKSRKGICLMVIEYKQVVVLYGDVFNQTERMNLIEKQHEVILNKGRSKNNEKSNTFSQYVNLTTCVGCNNVVGFIYKEVSKVIL